MIDVEAELGREVRPSPELDAYLNRQRINTFGSDQIQITIDRKDIRLFVEWISAYMAYLTANRSGGRGDHSNEAIAHWANMIVSLLDEPKITTEERS